VLGDAAADSPGRAGHPDDAPVEVEARHGGDDTVGRWR
jgi:hypothetical protein